MKTAKSSLKLVPRLLLKQMLKSLLTVKDQVTWPVKAKVTDEVVYLDALKKNSAVIASAGEEVDENGYFVDERVCARMSPEVW